MLPSQHRRRSHRDFPTRPPLPAPTRDVLASTVYQQTWRHTNGAPILGFSVLALDADDAITQGGIHLATHDTDAREWTCQQNAPVPDASIDRVRVVLQSEDDEERAYREHRYRRTEESVEPDVNAVSAAERLEAAHHVLQERRR